MSGLVEKLAGKSNIAVMADRGFTIRDQLKELGAELNIPPFMEGKSQLPATEVLEGRKIASLRIGPLPGSRTILKGSLPITLTSIANNVFAAG